MGHLQRLTRYFRQSLIDAERLCPADRDVLPLLGPDKPSQSKPVYLALPHDVWQEGRLPAEQAAAILAQHQGRSRRQLNEVELVLFPRVDLLRVAGGERDSLKREVLLPLVVFVRLERGGRFRPAETPPWIPREWLAPNQSAAAPIADAVAVDAFMTQYPFGGIDDWSALVAYCTRLLCWVAGQSYDSPNAQHSGTSLFDFPLHDNYVLNEQSLLQVADLPVVGAKRNILRVLDTLIGGAEPPPLYHRYASQASPALEPYRDRGRETRLAIRHLGQMTGEFPLSPKQRSALHHFLEQREGDILAVNGPPGTGKTTLLRSVVANLWAQAALEEAEPPLIVAASNNNQAVTNILESFAKVDEAGLDPRLAGRWLPDVDSYGLYCCAKNKANGKNPYRYHGPGGEGAMQVWQTREYLDAARGHFLAQASDWQGRPVTGLEVAKRALHDTMVQRQRDIAVGIERLDTLLATEREIDAEHGDIETLCSKTAALRERWEALAADHGALKERLDALYALWEARSLGLRLLSLLPGIGHSLRRQEHRKTARLLNQWDIVLEDHSDGAVEGWFRERIETGREALGEVKQTLAALEALAERYRSHHEALEAWIERYSPSDLKAKEPAAQVEEINDRVLRFELFKLATHYWEARWCLELDEFLTRNDTDRKSPAKLLRKLRRFAKLTPCFVSTFYMTPSTFIAWEKTDGAWRDIPLLGEIDLLIVDEAGQALPEVSAASFALAKRALVVGDTDQIEPVWSVPAHVDRANLALCGLLECQGADSYDDFWINSGLLASGGNLMRIAQRQCGFHQFETLQRGLYLTEHRRCYDPIIGYCNALVYRGVLEPLRGEPDADKMVPWGMLSLVPLESASRAYGGSRGNPGEARRIAAWLGEERERILRYVRQADEKLQEVSDREALVKTVGIITPFSRQAGLICHELRHVGIEGLTVGTVHSLQGAERLLVLFSSVYGPNDMDTGKFYDRGHNMLNVAVSRAKDAFIVFGHLDVFGTTSPGSPSALLRHRLEVHPGEMQHHAERETTGPHAT